MSNLSPQVSSVNRLKFVATRKWANLSPQEICRHKEMGQFVATRDLSPQGNGPICRHKRFVATRKWANLSPQEISQTIAVPKPDSLPHS